VSDWNEMFFRSFHETPNIEESEGLRDVMVNGGVVQHTLGEMSDTVYDSIPMNSTGIGIFPGDAQEEIEAIRELGISVHEWDRLVAQHGANHRAIMRELEACRKRHSQND